MTFGRKIYKKYNENHNLMVYGVDTFILTQTQIVICLFQSEFSSQSERELVLPSRSNNNPDMSNISSLVQSEVVSWIKMTCTQMKIHANTLACSGVCFILLSVTIRSQVHKNKYVCMYWKKERMGCMFLKCLFTLLYTKMGEGGLHAFCKFINV